MNYKLRNGIISIYETENITFVDVLGGRRLSVPLSIERGFFDGVINMDVLSIECRMIIKLLIEKKYIISLDMNESIRKIVDEIMHGYNQHTE